MKKFKLIKKYPNSPELNTIITKIDTYWGYPDGDGSNRVVFLRKDKPEDYPEYWEEVVENDYEILSVSIRRSDKHEIIEMFNTKDNTYAIALANCAGNSIHSVKRLSDGEIFTIDDNTKYGCIDSFYFKNNKLFATTVLESFGRILYSLVKIKQPLFTTEDGVDIYPKDRISTVLLEKMELYSINNTAGEDTTPVDGFKYFSTKEKAEEYIKLNSIRYSLKDIKEAFGESRTLSFKSIFNKLKQ